MNKILNSVKKSIKVLSVAEKYPGQGVYSATVDHKYIIKKYSDYILSENRFRGFCDINHAHTVDIKSYCTLRKNRKKSYQVVSAHVVPNSLKGSLKFTSIWLPFFRLYLRSFYNTADNILAVSNETKNEIIRDLNIDAEKIIVFTNFVRKDMFYRTPEEKEKLRNVYRKKLGFSDSDFIVICSGQVQPRKGIKDFYDLAVTFPEVKFIWTGGTPFKGATEGYHEMKKLVESAPENLIFTGNIERDEMINYYALSDLFFLPSFHETFGLVTLMIQAYSLYYMLSSYVVCEPVPFFFWKVFGGMTLLNMVVYYIPTPGASGSVEASYHILFTSFTGDSKGVLLAIFGWRFATYYLQIILDAVFVFFYNVFHKEVI